MGIFRATWRYISGLVTAGASGIGIFLAFQQWYPNAAESGKIAIIVLSLLLCGTVILLIIQECRLSRNARYAEIVDELNYIFGSIQTATSDSGIARTEIKRVCTDVVNRLANIFALVSDRRCGVCIKIIAEEDPSRMHGQEARIRVATLCRDDKSNYRESRSSQAKHWVDKNTDFEDLFSRTERHFYSNALPLLRDYKNSSFGVYQEPAKVAIPILGDTLRYLSWPLPYRSTIVTAIFPHTNAGLAADAEDVPDAASDITVVGYLCVDSKSGFTFSKVDIELVIGIADALYRIVQRYQRKRLQEYRRSLR